MPSAPEVHCFSQFLLNSIFKSDDASSWVKTRRDQDRKQHDYSEMAISHTSIYFNELLVVAFIKNCWESFCIHIIRIFFVYIEFFKKNEASEIRAQ